MINEIFTGKNYFKTYATRDGAKKAITKVLEGTTIRFLIAVAEDGRFFPVAIGEDALKAGVAHKGFAVTL